MATPMNVLLVEDTEDDARLLARHLRRSGLEARCERVETPEDMAAALADGPWDVILCDYKMPKINVPRALEIMRDSGLEIPFLVVSGTIGEEEAANLMKAGAHDLVLKGNLARLVPAIERELGEAETRRERKRAEEALRRKTTFLELLQSAAVAANEASTFEKAVQICLDRACGLTGWPVGHAYLRSQKGGGELVPADLWYLEDEEAFRTFKEVTMATTFAPGVGLPGRVLARAGPAWIVDVTTDPNFPRARLAQDIGVRAGFAFPVLVGTEVTAVLEFFSREAVPPDEPMLESMAHVGTQLGRAAERQRAAEALSQHAHDLGERFKELTGLYSLSKIFDRQGISLEETLQAAVEVLPPAWHYPEITCARITFDGRDFTTENFEKTVWRQASNIAIGEELVGAVEVFYLEEKPELDEGPFLREARILIDDIAARIGRNIDRKRTETELHKLTRAVEQSGSLIVITDTAGTIEYVNPQVAETTGYAAGELIGQNPRILKSGETSQPDYERLWSTITAGGNWRGEFHNKRKDGTLYWVAASISPVIDPDGTITHFVGIEEDVTQQKETETKLRQAQKMETVGQLTGGIAHDFNNLLTIIMGNLELAERAVTGDETLAKRMRSAMRAAQRGAELTQQLLAFSRRQALNPTVLDINHYVGGLEDMLRRTLGETVDLRFRLRDDVWRTRLDAGQLENALINLAINARDAMPEGGRLTIETTNAELDAQYTAVHPYVRPGAYVMLAVSDTGAGIPAEIVDQVFEPFFTTKEKGKGTGLGLSMVYGFVKQSEGHVNVYSEPGQGTSVKLYFPRFDASDGAAVTMTSGPATAAGGTETILAVEDDEGVRETTELMLTSLGYRVLTAEDGRAALALLDERRDVDLVLTDVVMPGGMSGFDLGCEIGARFPGVKVAYVSGYADGAVRGNGAMGDDVVIVSKPYSGGDLAVRIRQALETER